MIVLPQMQPTPFGGDYSPKDIGSIQSRVLDSCIEHLPELEDPNQDHIQLAAENLRKYISLENNSKYSSIENCPNIMISSQLNDINKRIESLDTNFSVIQVLLEKNLALKEENLKDKDNSTEESEKHVNQDSLKVLDNNLDLFSDFMLSQAKKLKTSLFPILCDSVDRSTLKDVFEIKLPCIESDKVELQNSLRDFLKSNGANITVYNKVKQTLDSADIWCTNVRDLYTRKALNKKSQAKKLYTSLESFSASNMDIYEFFRIFELISADYEIPMEKAELLYIKYLDSDLQEDLVRYKDDFSAMKNFLIEKYGNTQIIIDNIILPVKSYQLPKSSDSIHSKLNYFRKYQCSLFKITKILQSDEMDTDQLKTYVYGHDFLKILLHLIPEWCVDTFIGPMQALSQSISKIAGKIAFNTLVSSVDRLYKKFDNLMILDSPTILSSRSWNSMKPTNTGVDTEQLLSKQRLPHSEGFPDTSSGFSSNASESDCSSDSEQTTLKKNWLRLDSKERVMPEIFPCTLSGHMHGIQDCPEFFMHSPSERVRQRKDCQFKHCTVCLQSSPHCRYKKCVNLKKVPSVLICSDCKNTSKIDDKACYSVLFCRNPTHAKPNTKELVLGLKQYFNKSVNSK